MKKQIRRGVFETNSSSVHSLTMCSSKEYDEFEKGNMFIKKWGSSKLYTKEEMIEKFKTMTDWRTKKPKYSGVDWDNEEEFKRALEETDYCTSEEYWNIVSDVYETFEVSYTDGDGKTVYAFGYYGHD